MTLNYGRPANPEAFVIAALIPLGLPVEPERDEQTPLPSHVVTAVAGHSDRYTLRSVVSVHSFGNTRAVAGAAAWDAYNRLLSLLPSDVLTLPDNSTASAWVDCVMPPTFADYRDPYIKRYAARYTVELRFTGAI